ncbi:hypothetical protein G3T20_05430 [Bordetella hinzii]|uniref:hypothetical protein n=1 Tax=Bordetella hinzii TaxID=103855 RepID=UPI0013EFCEF4|nr:hypothetical protein [Bordetella hinzii]QII84192.1 hypothetical protein G3T20_05430 [Bordetella hinzii]
MSYTFTIRASELQAVLLAAPKKDVRFYLNSVLFEFTPGGFLNLVATDGHRLHALRVYLQYADDAAPRVPAGTQVLVPEDALRRIKVGRRDPDSLEVTFDPNDVNTWNIAIRLPSSMTLETVSIDGRFPDYRRLFLSERTAEKYGSRQPAVTLDPEFTSDACKALDILGAGPNKKRGYSFLYHEDVAMPVLVVSREYPHFIALIQPRRDNDYTSADIPEWVMPRVEEFA